MVSAPPARSSTTICAPSSRPSSAARMRATVSVALPAACGTINPIGRSGYSAKAPVGNAVHRSMKTNRRLRMLTSRHASMLAHDPEEVTDLSGSRAGEIGLDQGAQLGGDGGHDAEPERKS